MPEPKPNSRWNPLARSAPSDDSRTYWFEILFVAAVLFFGVSRWLENRADIEKRREYLAGIRADIDEELQTNRTNLNDCNRDIRALTRILERSQSPGLAGADSIPLLYYDVFMRGVFRAFQPRTYDLMVTNGDIGLLKDLKLRQTLTGTFAFRSSNLKTAFSDFDAEVKRSTQTMGQFMDLYAMQRVEAGQRIPFDQAGFRKMGRNAVFQVLRAAQVKAFYLEISTDSFQELKEVLEKLDADSSGLDFF